MKVPLSRRRAALVAAAVALIAIGIDSSSKRLATAMLPYHHSVPTPIPWVGLRRTEATMVAPFGSTELGYLFSVGPLLVIILLVAVGAARYRRPAIGIGLMAGAATSALFEFLLSGHVTEFIAVHTATRVLFEINIGVIEGAIGTLLLAFAVAEGTFMPTRPLLRESLRGHNDQRSP